MKTTIIVTSVTILTLLILSLSPLKSYSIDCKTKNGSILRDMPFNSCPEGLQRVYKKVPTNKTYKSPTISFEKGDHLTNCMDDKGQVIRNVYACPSGWKETNAEKTDTRSSEDVVDCKNSKGDTIRGIDTNKGCPNGYQEVEHEDGEIRVWSSSKKRTYIRDPNWSSPVFSW